MVGTLRLFGRYRRLKKYTMQAMSGDTVCRRSGCGGWGGGISKGQSTNFGQWCVSRHIQILCTYLFAVPLVVVFTKRDLLVGKLNLDARENNKRLDDAAMKKREQESLEELCLAPVWKAAGPGNLSHVVVSST